MDGRKEVPMYVVLARGGMLYSGSVVDFVTSI